MVAPESKQATSKIISMQEARAEAGVDTPTGIGTKRVLIAEDESLCRHTLSFALKSEQYEVLEAKTAEEALSLVAKHPVDMVLLDIHLPEKGGEAVLNEIRRDYPHVSVIILTGDHDQELALRCLKAGAQDFLTKPCGAARLLTTIANTLHMRDLEQWLRETTEQYAPDHSYGPIFGKTPAMRQIFQQFRVLEKCDAPVLLEGPAGNGKEWAAHALHERSARKDHPFVSVNCHSLPDHLLEHVLFGTVTPETAKISGIQINGLQQAKQGTLFIGGIDGLKPEWQMRLNQALRANPDPRLMSSSTQDLKALMEDGKFLPELYYRLAVFRIQFPPLSERVSDIPDLTERLLLELAVREGKRGLRITPAAQQLISAYTWSGNLRELRNVLERAVVLAQGSMIRPEDLPDFVRKPGPAPVTQKSPAAENAPAEKPPEIIQTFVEEERIILQRALDLTEGDVTSAAQRLGIGRATLYRRIKELNLNILR